nr:PIN domain-containing protein [Saprospiraceae bacterium]
MSKIFVLDTSVLLFDHNAILNFQDNNIVIPITVLEELDNFKIGNDTKNFEAREVIRNLDKLAEHNGLNEWIPLGDHLGKLKIFNSQAENLVNDAEKIYGKGKGDHKIINAALDLKSKSKRAKVVLVTKDINLRLKAKALGLDAE